MARTNQRARQGEAELWQQGTPITVADLGAMVIGDEGCQECGSTDLEPVTTDEMVWRCNECRTLYTVQEETEEDDGDDGDD